MLINLWPIVRHTKLIVEKVQFMYASVIDVSINLVTHFIDIIQKATKKMSLPFERLITRITIMAKVPLFDNEPTIKMYGKILVVIVVKSEVMVSKKRSYHEESTSSKHETPRTNPLLPLIIE